MKVTKKRDEQDWVQEEVFVKQYSVCRLHGRGSEGESKRAYTASAVPDDYSTYFFLPAFSADLVVLPPLPEVFSTDLIQEKRGR